MELIESEGEGRFIEGEADSSLQPLAAGLYTGGAVALEAQMTKCLVRDW